MHKLAERRCILYLPSLFPAAFRTAWPTLLKRFSFPPLFLSFPVTSSMCNKPCVNLHRTKRGQPFTRYKQQKKKKNQGSRKGVKVLQPQTVVLAACAHSAEKASKCQSHSFLTADLMEKSCPSSTCYSIFLHLSSPARRYMPLLCVTASIFTPHRCCSEKMITNFCLYGAFYGGQQHSTIRQQAWRTTQMKCEIKNYIWRLFSWLFDWMILSVR